MIYVVVIPQSKDGFDVLIVLLDPAAGAVGNGVEQLDSCVMAALLFPNYLSEQLNVYLPLKHEPSGVPVFLVELRTSVPS